MNYEYEALKNTNKVVLKHNIREDELKRKLTKEEFSLEETDKIIRAAKACKLWTNRYIVVVYFKDDDNFSIITNGYFMNLIS